ncbi:MAG: 4Fe-4S dicluster domain-containing protein [Dehalococcoidia bacterium]|nr:4Fe-4S dicluster domain-containing protein [Dehalococcoidia bacterium]
MLQLNAETVHTCRDTIKRLSGEDVSRCFQCGKCTAGCPVAIDMDVTPNQVMRLAQINGRERVLASSTIWLCLSCETCSTRCPADIDIAKVMDTLRKISVAEGYPSPEPAITGFHRLFLASVEKYGRLNELELSIKHNLAIMKPTKDIRLAVGLFSKGKINPFGGKVKDRERVKKIFAESQRFVKVYPESIEREAE